jgi:poly(A) polymerase
MLKWLSDTSKQFNGWLGKEKNALPSDPHIVPREQHNISRKHISDAALKVIARLRSGGYDAYLVGGGVRDLLLGLRPKDFDVATNAHPEQIRKLFNNARIIGRRFKIVHVRYGREIIEVTTFRSTHEAKVQDKGTKPGNHHSAQSEDGMLLRDNVFGTVEDDAVRRDFTINALYYTTADFAVYDYTNGLRDLHSKTIRIIGDAEKRYREDPVRMLRAIRFSAKLGFTIEAKTEAPIAELGHTLANVPASRMFDEILKLLMSGYSEKVFALLQQYGLVAYLFPQTASCIEGGQTQGEALIHNAMINTDKRIQAGKPVTPAFIYAALLWPAVQQRFAELKADGVPDMPAITQAGQEVTSAQQQHTSIPKRFSYPMREIWELQLRLPYRNGRKAENLVQGRRFRAAYDFLLLREQAGEQTDGLGKWWTNYQNSDPDKREAMSQAVQGPGKGRRRPRRSNKPQ